MVKTCKPGHDVLTSPRNFIGDGASHKITVEDAAVYLSGYNLGPDDVVTVYRSISVCDAYSEAVQTDNCGDPTTLTADSPNAPLMFPGTYCIRIEGPTAMDATVTQNPVGAGVTFSGGCCKQPDDAAAAKALLNALLDGVDAGDAACLATLKRLCDALPTEVNIVSV